MPVILWNGRSQRKEKGYVGDISVGHVDNIWNFGRLIILKNSSTNRCFLCSTLQESDFSYCTSCENAPELWQFVVDQN